MNGKSVLIGAVVAIAMLATAAVLFSSGDASMERLGLLFGLLGPTVLGLLALARSDAAAKSTDATSGIAKALDGNFDARVRNALRHVNAEPASRPEPIEIADHDPITTPTVQAAQPTPAPIADPVPPKAGGEGTT